MLPYLDMPTLCQPEVYLRMDEGWFDAQGDIANADTKRFIQQWMDHCVA